MNEMEQICIASCFAFHDPRCVAFFNRLGDELAKRKTQLIVLTTVESPDCRFPQFHIPYSILDWDREIQLSNLVPFHATAPIKLAETAWGGANAKADAIARSIAKCEWFYQAIAEELAPVGALLWNTTHPHSRVARNVLLVNDTPAWCFERGQLAGTYQVQLNEVSASEDIQFSFAQHAGLTDDLQAHRDGTAFDAARALSISAPVGRYAPKGTFDAARIPKGKGPSILVLTSAVGSSIEPAVLRSVSLSQPFWPSMQGIIDALGGALPGDATVIFRDHPINRLRAGYKLRLPWHFIEADDVPIGDLIDHADRILCIGNTTLQYEALLRDKPLLMLGRSLSASAGAAYVPTSADGLSACVAAWLVDAEGPRHRANARALVGLLCDRHLIREHEDAGHVRNGVAELAGFIAAQAVPQGLSVQERIDSFVERVVAACSFEENAKA